VRGPDDATLRDIARVGGPIAFTSANRHGELPCTNAAAVLAAFAGDDQLAGVLDGGERHGVLQGLPSLDAGVLEGVVHGSEPGPDSLGWDLGMDVDDGVGGLGDDPNAPQRPVEIAFGEP
jgi:hypothetical protein